MLFRSLKNIFFSFNDNTKLFTSYNNSNKLHRNILVDVLAKNNLLNDGIVTILHPNIWPNRPGDYKFEYYDGTILKDEPSFVLNSCDAFAPNSFPKSYLNGFIDIVTESTYEEDQFFLTEKTSKPISTLKPFLIVGPPKIHKFLYENYGVEYYDELFDYSFDDETEIGRAHV